MDDPQPIAKHEALAAKCMHCGYDLRSSPTDRCPECGKTFDPALLRRRTWKRRLIALAVMAFVMYAPFGWLLLVTDDPTYTDHDIFSCVR